MCYKEAYSTSIPLYESAKKLEQFMGSTESKDGTFSFKKILDADESELYPSDAIKQLNEWGMQHYYIPTRLNGKFRYAEETAFLMRLIARRDLTLAITHGGALLGAMPIWLSGDTVLQNFTAKSIKEGKRFALALTEKKHGSDISANEFSAITADGYLSVEGNKWLINHAEKAENIVVLAKTDEHHSMRNYSLILINKESHPEANFKYERIRTVGLRGLNLGDIEISNLNVSLDKIIGKKGQGMETVIKSLQVTRFMCIIFSLGAADTALRTTIKFMNQRVLYGNKIINIPILQDKLIHLVAKGTLPDMMDSLINELSNILGARALLRSGSYSILQKMKRDHSVIPVFDGNTLVNLQYIISQLGHIAKSPVKVTEDTKRMCRELFNLERTPEELNLEKLRLFGKRNSFLKNALWCAKLHLENNSIENNTEFLYPYVNQFIDEWKKLDSLILNDKDSNISNTYTIPPIYYEYARKISLLQLASACLNIWLYNSEYKGSPLFKRYWIESVIEYLLGMIEANKNNVYEIKHNDEALNDITEIVENNMIFSIIPFNVL